MLEIIVFATVLVPIIAALVEVIKKAVSAPINLIPLIAVVVGLIVGAAAYPFNSLELSMRLWAGVLAGLASTGLFELVKQREEKSKKGGY